MDTRTPDISVVIPVFNRRTLMRRTLDSLLPQAADASRIVLVDNNSTDGSLSELQRWAAKVPNAMVVTQLKPGASAARNRGLECVEPGGYVLFFDSDDVMPQGHIRAVANELVRQRLPDIGGFGAVIHWDNGHVLRQPWRRRGSVMMNAIFHGVLSTQRMVVATDVLRRVGGWDNDLMVWDDWELGLRMLSAGATVKELRLPHPVEIHAHDESITGPDFGSKAGEWERTLDAVERLLPARYAPIVNYRRATLAGKYRSEGRKDLARSIRYTHRRRWMSLISLYVAAGGRGVAELARITELLP